MTSLFGILPASQKQASSPRPLKVEKVDLGTCLSVLLEPESERYGYGSPEYFAKEDQLRSGAYMDRLAGVLVASPQLLSAVRSETRRYEEWQRDALYRLSGNMERDGVRLLGQLVKASSTPEGSGLLAKVLEAAPDAVAGRCEGDAVTLRRLLEIKDRITSSGERPLVEEIVRQYNAGSEGTRITVLRARRLLKNDRRRRSRIQGKARGAKRGAKK